MTSERKALEKELRRHLSLFGSPSTSQLDASRARIRERLRSGEPPALSDTAPEERPSSRARYVWRTSLPLATAATLAVLIVTVPWRSDGIATVEAADGSHYTLKANAVLRAGDAGGAMLTLKDGSRVEVRSQSELALEHAADGIGIRLRTGAVIVDRAKQSGHLYVHTKDMTVAVVGTAVVVNAEDVGSRVTAIEGDVRVRERTTETRLRPGEQVSTSPALALRPVKDEISWSRNADKILAAFTKGMADTSGTIQLSAKAAETAAAGLGQRAAQDFEEASIKQCDPDHLPAQPENGRGGGANSFQLTPGRLRALCVTPATLVRVAYGYNPLALDFNRDGPGPQTMTFGNVYGIGEEDGRRVRNAPDWTRSERYTIEAVAGPSVKPDAQMLRGPMLQRLLERRFQLKLHVDSEQVPAFALTVAKGGLKIKPVTSEACDELPARPGSMFKYGHPTSVLAKPRTLDDLRRGEKPSCGMWGGRNGPNQVIIGGGIPIESLLLPLGLRLGGVRVMDRTGVTDSFNYVLEFVLDENTPGLGPAIPDPGSERDVSAASTIFTALEEQLGLKLEQARAPREFIVIDRIERPSPN
jgi:uncharacterized protein (TIGR03435 family)